MNPADLPPDRLINLTQTFIEERLHEEDARMQWEQALAQARGMSTGPVAAVPTDDGFSAYAAAAGNPTGGGDR